MDDYRETTNNRIDESEKIDITGLLWDVWHGIIKCWWILIGLAIVFAIQSYFSVSTTYTPSYQASATMAVKSGDSSASYVNAQSAKQLEGVFPYILTSGVLREVVAEDMGLGYFPGSITAQAEEGTNLFTLSATANDPQVAYNLLHSVLENYPKVARFVIGETTLEILDETGIPSDTQRTVVVRGSYRRGAMKGILLGLMIMVIYILTRKTVKSRKELKNQVNLEDFGSIPYIHEKKRKKDKFRGSLCLKNDRVPQAYLEAIRKFRIKVMKEMEAKSYKTLLVTSSIPGEGKTTLAANLAISIAKQGKKVVLIDCDMRNPSLAAEMNDTEEHPGLEQVVRGKVTLAQALTKIEIDGGQLEVLYGGKPTNKDTNVLGTKSIGKLLGILAKHADVVILDTAPSDILADTAILARSVDAALYVVKYDHAKMRQIRGGVQALSMSGIDLIGYVFNADKTKSRQAFSYGYSYGYKRYGGYGHYGNYHNIGKRADTSGRVIKD